jgi:hypothetical protein
MLTNYRDSVDKFLGELDVKRPIWVQMQNLPGSNNQWDSKQEFSWSNILHDDLTESSCVNLDYSGGVSDLDRRDSHMRRFLVRNRIVNKRFGLDPEFYWHETDTRLKYQTVDLSLYGIVPARLKETKLPQWDGKPIYSSVDIPELELLLRLLFSPHPLQSEIPKEWWSEMREKERPYSDFLEVYKVWQELSKGVWADYYRSLGKETLLAEREKKKVVNHKAKKSWKDCKRYKHDCSRRSGSYL